MKALAPSLHPGSSKPWPGKKGHIVLFIQETRQKEVVDITGISQDRVG